MRPTLAVIIPVGDDIGSLPGFGGGWGSGNRPDNSLPGGGHVSPPIYHPGHPDHGLPVQPGHPGNRPPGSWGGPIDPGFGQGGGRPDQGLPGQGGHPGNRPPGSGGGRPDNSLPWAPVRPGQGLPGEQPGIDNSLPGGWGRPDQGLPGAQPKAYSAAIPPKPPESVNTEQGIWVIVDVNGTLAWAWAQKPESQPGIDNSLPGSQPGIDNSLPGGKPPGTDNTLPETPEPK